LAALPSLQHLHLALWVLQDEAVVVEGVGQAALAVLAPLQHSTALTSLVLDGPWDQERREGRIPDADHVQLLNNLPRGLRSLSWRMYDLQDPQQLSFDSLTGLTALRLAHSMAHDEALGPGAFTALKQLRRLDLDEIWVSDEGYEACKEQLVVCTPQIWTDAISKLTQLRSFSLNGPPNEDMFAIIQQLPALQHLKVRVENEDDEDLPGWDAPCGLQQPAGMTQLRALTLELDAPQVPPPGLLPLGHLKQLRIEMFEVPAVHAVPWAWALAGLVNLELLTIPADLTACWHPWLTGLTRLALLEVGALTEYNKTLWRTVQLGFDVPSVATHISRLLESGTGSSSSGRSSSGNGSGSSGSSSSGGTSAGVPGTTGRVLMVCLDVDKSAKLYSAVAAAVPVLPPGKHLFRGSWELLQECGVELWPAPVAARLQQLLEV
jgi:hypothetical protein